MGRRRRIYTKAEIDAMVNLVSKNSYEDAAKLMEQQFPNAKYSASQLHTQVKLATGSSPPPRESAMVHTPNLAGAALPPSIISQYSKSESVQSRPVATGLEEVDNYSHIDWSNQMDATDPFQYVITNSFTPGNGLPQVEDLFQVWLQAMKEVTNSIPRIQANSWKTNMLNALYRKFNPEPTSQQPQDNT